MPRPPLGRGGGIAQAMTERFFRVQAQKAPSGIRSEGEKLSFRKRVCKAGPTSLLSLLKYDDHCGVLISVFLECTNV